MEEVWKDMKGYVGLYKVSNYGRILGVRGKVLKPVKNVRNGYMQVTLCVINGVRKRIYIHRAVAEAFIPNQDNKPCVDHINTIREDNRAKNLRWVTVKENHENELTKYKHNKACKKSNSNKGRAVLQMIKGKIVREYKSMREAEMITKIHKYSISCCCSGKRKTAGGYNWMYKIPVR